MTPSQHESKDRRGGGGPTLARSPNNAPRFLARRSGGPPWTAALTLCGVHRPVPAHDGVQAHRRPAPRDRRAVGGARPRRRLPDAARRHGIGQDVHDGPGDRAGRAARARDRPQQDAGRPAVQRVPRAAARRGGRVLRQLLRLLPARGLHRGHGHVHREGLVDQRRDRPPAPLGHRRPAGPPRRGDRGLGELHLRRRLARDLPRPGRAADGGRGVPPREDLPPPGRDPVPAQRHGARARPLPGARRHPRGAAGRLRDGLPHLDVRRRGGEHHRVRPAHRRGPRHPAAPGDLPGDALHHPAGDHRPGAARHPRRARGAAARVRGGGQAGRGPPPAPAHRVRHGDDPRARVLLGHRELLAHPRRARAR